MLQGNNGFIQSIAFSPDGQTAISGTWHRTIILWDIATGRSLKTFSGYSGSRGINSLAFAPDGRTILSAHNRNVMLWNVEIDYRLRSFSGHLTPIVSVALAPDGQTAQLIANGVIPVRYDGMPHDEQGIVSLGNVRIVWFRDPAGNLLSLTSS